jgi:hypothetical protein
MRAENTQSRPDEFHTNVRPIEFLTENGFSIVRRWEADGGPAPVDGQFSFLVRNPQDLESEVTVKVAGECLQTMPLRARARVPLSSSFWISCAENHLAEYLWEHNAFPTDNQLMIDCVSPAEIISATQWRSE